MTQNPPPRHPSAPEPGRGGEAVSHEDGPEPADAAQASTDLKEETDPYDDLWDPNMNTRPERIRKTKARSRTDARGKGGPPPRGKRREGA